MKCEDYKEKLLEIAENGADISSYPEVSKHIETCGDCRREFDELKALFGIMEKDKAREYEDTRLDSLVVDVNQRINNEEKTVRFDPKYFFSILTATAAAILILVMGTVNFTDTIPINNGYTYIYDDLTVSQLVEMEYVTDDLVGELYSEIDNESLTELEDYYLENYDYQNILSDLDDDELEYINTEITEKMKNIS
ncbi:MAG: hypothetical protein GF315_04380 [candidate division Zixibacteria bacterium]|nr:hypothetical protein [candidate division Zixibacteria bacterium]